MQRVVLGFSLLAACAAIACSHGADKPAKRADGSFDLACGGPLSACLRQAERLCGDDGYTVASARDARELLGHESGQSQVPIEKSYATIFCGTSGKSERAIVELEREPKSVLEPEPAPETKAPPAPPPRACVPGATQACIGPAGCQGGQSCAADGSRFESCDCGKPAIIPTTP